MVEVFPKPPGRHFVLKPPVRGEDDLDVDWDNQPTGKLRFEWGDGTSAASIDSTRAPSADTWYYTSARWTGSQFRLQVNQDTVVTSASVLVPALAQYLYFGTTDDGTSNKLTGSLSSWSWHKGLSLADSELTAHYNSGSGRECCPIK